MIFPNHHSLTLIYESANSLVYRALREEDNQAVIRQKYSNKTILRQKN